MGRGGEALPHIQLSGLALGVRGARVEEEQTVEERVLRAQSNSSPERLHHSVGHAARGSTLRTSAFKPQRQPACPQPAWELRLPLSQSWGLPAIWSVV